MQAGRPGPSPVPAGKVKVVPMNWQSEDTIAAIATPFGVGGVGMIRLSGPDAVAIADPLFRPAGGGSLAGADSHRMVYGWIHADGEPVDEVLAVWMKAPRSYTREDVVEFHCHGGPLVLQTVLELVCRAGARLARPGEFTQRAFFNGRIDLTQVEAVGDIVSARSRAGLRVSANQLRGRLHQAISELKEELAHVAALVEAGIDFPEEDIVLANREEITGRLSAGKSRLADLVATAERGRILREGLGTAIVGKPNVGKSSLLNALLRENRAIVTEIPGTTRDTLEEATEVGGVMLRLIDTAGIRRTEDRVELEGIARSRKAIEMADLVLLVLDGTAPLDADDEALLAMVAPAAALVLVNKRDLMPGPAAPWAERLEGFESLTLSALTGAGMEALETWVRNWALSDERPLFEHALITNLRQKQAAEKALDAVEAALGGLEQGVGDELLAVDLSRALAALGEIVGETTADDLLERIFAEFCIGK